MVYDSRKEASFTLQLELSEDVKVYVKLSGWFRIDTPFGMGTFQGT
jgi:type III restriction enzyme